MTEEDTRRLFKLLASIDNRLSNLEGSFMRAEVTFGAFMAGPGKKLARLFGNGKAGGE